MRKNYVTFCSPGTLFSELSSREIEGWNPSIAVEMSEEIKERHGAIPYGFRFETRIVLPPVSDGEGGECVVEPKVVATSGIHFICGELQTFDEVEARKDPKDSILLDNMRCNDYPIIVVVKRGYTTTMPFSEKDCVVDMRGRIIETGDDPRYVEYRKVAAEKAKKYYEEQDRIWNAKKGK